MSGEDLTLWEQIYMGMGLNNPLQRCLTTFVIVSGIIYISKTSMFFDEDGQPRSGWWTPGLVLGIISGVFV